MDGPNLGEGGSGFDDTEWESDSFLLGLRPLLMIGGDAGATPWLCSKIATGEFKFEYRTYEEPWYDGDAGSSWTSSGS